jgi:hypothetical protein
LACYREKRGFIVVGIVLQTDLIIFMIVGNVILALGCYVGGNYFS